MGVDDIIMNLIQAFFMVHLNPKGEISCGSISQLNNHCIEYRFSNSLL